MEGGNIESNIVNDQEQLSENQVQKQLSEDQLQKQAIANLINGIQVAQSRGSFTLDESAELLKSIQLFLVKN